MWWKKVLFLGIVAQFLLQPARAQQLKLVPKAHHQLISANLDQVSNFDSDFCTQPQTTEHLGLENRIEVLCFGHMKFHQTIAVRAFILKMTSGKKLVYLENDLPGVELLKTSFSVIGPTEPDQQFEPTVGRTQILIDGDGEVTGLLVELSPFGFISAVSQ